jgi:hypothetical protein
LGDLLSAIASERPNRRDIQDLTADLRNKLGLNQSPESAPSSIKRDLQPTPLDTGPSANQGPIIAQVRQLLLSLYPNLDELIILFEDTLGTGFQTVVGSGTQTIQVHAMVKWAFANCRFRLCPLLAAVANQHKESKELENLRRQLCSD